MMKINRSLGYLIGVDIGTTTSKGVIITPGGDTVAACTFEHEVDRPHPGWAEHDADRVWWADFVRVCRALLQKSSIDPHQILAAACSTLCPVLLPVDKDGRPLRSGILYSIDTRTVDEIEILKNSLGDEYSIRISSNRFSSQIILTKILWVQRHEPAVFQKTARFLYASSYVVFRLTKNYVVDHASASIGGLPYNINTLDWDDDACREVKISREQLPRLLFGHEIAGRISSQAAAETGLPEGLPVAVGTIDHMAEMISLGAVKKGGAVLGYGTTFGLDVCTDKKIYYPGLMIARSCCSQDVYLIGGAMSSGAGLTRWYRDNFAQKELELEKQTGLNAYESLSNAAGSVQPGSEGLIILPYFNGERCPIIDPEARGMIFGLTLRHTGAHIYRAILESIAFGIRHIVDALRTGGITVEQVTMVGGGTLSSVWTQIVSDVTQLDQRLLKQASGSQFGAAYLAGLAVGAIELSQIERQWDSYGAIVKPNPENQMLYEKYYQIYRNLYLNTAEEMHQL
jgi:xylulokinase